MIGHECELCHSKATHKITLFAPGGSESEWYCAEHRPSMSVEIEE